jgi:hypothetical protein
LQKAGHGRHWLRRSPADSIIHAAISRRKQQAQQKQQKQKKRKKEQPTKDGTSA